MRPAAHLARANVISREARAGEKRPLGNATPRWPVLLTDRGSGASLNYLAPFARFSRFRVESKHIACVRRHTAQSGVIKSKERKEREY